MKKNSFIVLFLALILLSACAASPTDAQPTPTEFDVSALQTAAVETIVAVYTQTAEAQPKPVLPSETSTPVPLVPTETVTPTPAISPTAQLCDNSAYVSDISVIDGMQMAAGQAFVKTWKIKNTGTCLWTKGYQMIVAYGEKMGGIPTAVPAEVLPGAEIEISINLVAPAKPGNYGGYWRLINNNGVPFGEIFTVLIVVQ